MNKATSYREALAALEQVFRGGDPDRVYPILFDLGRFLLDPARRARIEALDGVSPQTAGNGPQGGDRRNPVSEAESGRKPARRRQNKPQAKPAGFVPRPARKKKKE